MYNINETVLPSYINGHCPIIKTCSDVTLNLSSKDYISIKLIHRERSRAFTFLDFENGYQIENYLKL